jgi:hypothetical protein
VSADVPVEVARARGHQQGTKIIIGGLTAVVEAWLDEGGVGAGAVSTWIIRPRSGMGIDTLYALLTILNSATFSRIYLQRHGAKAMSGKQTTIQKQALLGMIVPCALCYQPAVLPGRGVLDLKDKWTQMAICHRAGRLLQSISPDSVMWGHLDKLGHVAAGLLYGQSMDACLDDYDWWCGRAGVPPSPASPTELVELLYPISPEGASIFSTPE